MALKGSDKQMRFLIRAVVGLGLLAATLGLLVMAVGTIYTAYEVKRDAGNRPRVARERSFSANVEQLKLQEVWPVIETFGEVRSGRTMELRAASGGAIVELSDGFREGGTVDSGELLFRTDPASAEASYRLAEAELAEAKAELSEAERAIQLANDDLDVAKSQLALRLSALERQDALTKRGVGTEVALETAGLAAASARQSVVGKQIGLSQAEARMERARLGLARREIALSEARRQLDDTRVSAEFAGVLTGITNVLGELVNANESLGQLIDPTALEVVFRVSSQEFERLVTADGGLEAVSIDVVYGPADTRIEARISRAGASVGEGQTGRELYASLGETAATFLRPGDFVSVTIQEPPLQDVAIIPATAASSANEILVVGEDNRLRPLTVSVLRRQRDTLVIGGDGVDGATVVLERVPQLGAGIRIQPRQPDAPEFEEVELVTLTAEEQETMTRALQANNRMPAEIRDRILAQVSEGKVPAGSIDRLRGMAARFAAQSGSGTGAGASGQQNDRSADATDSGASADQPATIALSDDERKAMVAFIEQNTRIPDDRKTSMLRALAEPEVPRELVDRLRSRIGG